MELESDVWRAVLRYEVPVQPRPHLPSDVVPQPGWPARKIAGWLGCVSVVCLRQWLAERDQHERLPVIRREQLRRLNQRKRRAYRQGSALRLFALRSNFERYLR